MCKERRESELIIPVVKFFLRDVDGIRRTVKGYASKVLQCAILPDGTAQPSGDVKKND